MRKSYCYLAAWLMAVLFSLAAFAQTVTISGTVRNSSTKEIIPFVSVVIKGTGQGAVTNTDGGFSLKVAKLPVVLVFTSAGGYDIQEVTVSNASQPIDIDLKVNNAMGQDVVVAATRTPQRILESPVSIERMGPAYLRNIAAPNYYEAITNLKGVDMHTASLTFRTVTTRGFLASGNVRMNQLVDGMDNQAPGLNFSVGNIIGPSELDVEDVELLPGASSALYGSGGMNGTVLINSKDPFKYPGFSYNIKQGIMHVDGKQHGAAPYYDWAFRWAKSYNDKFAIKLSFELVKGNDWQAEDYRDKQQIGVLSSVVGGNRSNDPNFNGINIYGDEVSADMKSFAQFFQNSTQAGLLAATGGAFNFINTANALLPANPTATQLNTFYASLPSTIVPTVQAVMPFYLGLRNNLIPNQSISRTGYEEKYLVDYNTLNAKFSGGIFYKITPNIEASFNTYFGTGTTVYTGADRYSLRNLKIAQHKLEFKGKTWMLRGYTTQENAGESYNATALGSFINEAWKPTATWLGQYIATYSETKRAFMTTAPISDYAANVAGRNAADLGRLIPGTKAFDSVALLIRKTPIKKGGALFLDQSDLYAGEFQLNLSDAGHFSDKVEVIAGTAWKQWAMNSQGTIFADTVSHIRVNEYGGYIQFKKKLFHEGLTLSASGRYDKQTNFTGRFTPRFTAVIKVAKDNNIRLSFQSAYHFPTNQDQYISLVTGSGALIGCLPSFQTFYKLNSTLPGYTPASILAYRATGNPLNTGILVKGTYTPVKPEVVNSFELGYKGILGKKMLVDAYVYFSKYKDFLARYAVGQSKTGDPSEVFSPFTTTNISYIQNSPQGVKAQGWGFGLEYKIIKNYTLYGNVYSDVLKDVPSDLVTFFNTPKYRFNIGLHNENVCHNIGFNVVVKWQDNNFYQGTFVTGTLPYFAWVDAQLTYRPPKTKSTFRVGGTNLGNNYYRTGFGSPAVGGLYYISYGYNLF